MIPLNAQQAETAKAGRQYFADKTMIEPVYFHAADPDTGNLCAVVKVECAEDLDRLKEQWPAHEIRQESLGDGMDGELVKKWHFDGTKFIDVHEELLREKRLSQALARIERDTVQWFEDRQERKLQNLALAAMIAGKGVPPEYLEFLADRENYLAERKTLLASIDGMNNDQLKDVAERADNG
jgi:hypothetical protein